VLLLTAYSAGLIQTSITFLTFVKIDVVHRIFVASRTMRFARPAFASTVNPTADIFSVCHYFHVIWIYAAWIAA
jgi:hypothetical protein